jgi:hypothetical protein
MATITAPTATNRNMSIEFIVKPKEVKRKAKLIKPENIYFY